MKYIKEAAIKTGAIYTIFTSAVLSIIYLTVNAKILIWISNAVTEYEHPVYWINLVILGCVFNTALMLIKPYFDSIGNHRIYTYLCNEMANKVVDADYEMFTKWSPGEVITATNDLWKITRCVIMTIEVLQNVISFTVTLATIASLEWKIAVGIIPVYCVGAIILNKIVKKWGEVDNEVDSIKSKRNNELDEIINGFTEVRSFQDASNKHRSFINDANDKIMQLIRKRIKVDSSISIWVDILDSVVMFGILGYSIICLSSGVMTVSTVAITLVMYGWRLINPVMGVVNGLNDLSECKAVIPRFEEIMGYKNCVPKGFIELESFDNEIEFRGVDFSYDKSSNVIQNLNFKIRKGEHIGICGPTGGGKSTLLKLIPKFYKVTGGMITVDGININDIESKSLISHIGIVHQSPYIFDGTIGYNIKYAGGYRNVSDTEMIEAAKKASIYEFIMSLPDGFDTQVGPRGLKLSGGQKQRIALARLFISNPSIIILDEATSALDNDTERFIQDSLNAFRDKTMIVVAHRLSTIKSSDKIIVIDSHRIVEEGTHDELMKLNGAYASMYNA